MTRGSADHRDEHHERCACGDTHQIATGDRPTLTTQQGTPVADDQNTLRPRAQAVASISVTGRLNFSARTARRARRVRFNASHAFRSLT